MLSSSILAPLNKYVPPVWVNPQVSRVNFHHHPQPHSLSLSLFLPVLLSLSPPLSPSPPSHQAQLVFFFLKWIEVCFRVILHCVALMCRVQRRRAAICVFSRVNSVGRCRADPVTPQAYISPLLSNWLVASGSASSSLRWPFLSSERHAIRQKASAKKKPSSRFYPFCRFFLVCAAHSPRPGDLSLCRRINNQLGFFILLLVCFTSNVKAPQTSASKHLVALGVASSCSRPSYVFVPFIIPWPQTSVPAHSCTRSNLFLLLTSPLPPCPASFSWRPQLNSPPLGVRTWEVLSASLPSAFEGRISFSARDKHTGA